MGKKIFFKIILGVVFLLFICIYVGVFNNDDKIDYSDTSLEHGQYLVFESIADSGSLLIEKFTINKRGKEFEIRKSLKIVESDGTELDMGSYSIIVKPSGELSEEYSLNATLAKNHELKFLKSYMANHTNLFGPPNLKTGEIFFGNLKITGESQFKDFDTYYINAGDNRFFYDKNSGFLVGYEKPDLFENITSVLVDTNIKELLFLL